MSDNQLKRKRGRPKIGNGAGSAADRVAASVNERNGIDRFECADPDRRKRLEGDPEQWLGYYMQQTYTRPFESPHRGIIKGAVEASSGGGRFVVAAERGIGKSAILWGLVLYLALSGKQPYPVCVPWADKALKRAFRFWKNALCYNERLLADYPEFCQPFAHAKGIAQRVPNVWWRDNEKLTGAQLTVGEGMIILPDKLGALGGATINGNIRGLNHPQEDGTVLRPTIVLLDDVQDRGVAKSPIQCADTISIIDGDVAGCGEVGRDMPMLMACNCICKSDVSDHYLNSKEWTALRIPCVQQWPAGWDNPDSECARRWDELREFMQLEDPKQAIAYYKKHRQIITDGMVLSAPSAFSGADNCPDEFYGAIRMYYRMGHEAFMAERQQDPVDLIQIATPYVLTVETILRRESKRAIFEKPDWVTKIVASSDCNPSYAFSTVVLGFGDDHTAAVLWYGLHRLSIDVENIPMVEYAKQLYNEAAKHGQMLNSLQCRPEAWALDAGGKQFDAIVPYVDRLAQATGLGAVYGFTGRDAKRYRPDGKTAVRSSIREQCHLCRDVKAGNKIKWVAWNTDYWGEVAQRAWLGADGAPGTVSLPRGTHVEFAQQICNQKLVGVGDVGGQQMWNWHKMPGKNDFHDAMAQGYALAALQGIGTSTNVVRKKKVANVVIKRR